MGKKNRKISRRNSSPITVAVSGGFDPIHIGHIRMIREALKLGDRLVVILNNDHWLKKKKTHIFMHQKERKEILESISGVNEVIITGHPKNPQYMDVGRELFKIRPDVFANGGDRKNENDIPEVEICRKIGSKMVFNVGKGGKIQSSSWLLKGYIEKLKPIRKINVKKAIGELRAVLLEKSPNRFPEKLRSKTAKIIFKLMNRKRGFGLFVIIGWQNRWNKYLDVPDKRQDVYEKHRQNILRHYKDHKYDIEKTVNFDGAILIDSRGNIVHSGIIIEGLRPRIVADKINPGRFNDLSEQFGFDEKVHSRHLSAITASYIFKGTTIFTVSEESDSFHVFEDGKIVFKV